MADIFFGKFSELISSEKISRETENKPESENQKYEKLNIWEKINNKFIIYILGVVLLLIVVFFVI